MEPDFRTELDRWQRVRASKRSREAVPSRAPALWRFFRDEVLLPVVALPLLPLLGVLAWFQHTEEPVWSRVLYTVATIAVAAAFVGVVVAGIILEFSWGP